MGKVQVGPLAEAALSGHFAVAEVLVAKGAYVQNRSGVRRICAAVNNDRFCEMYVLAGHF